MSEPWCLKQLFANFGSDNQVVKDLPAISGESTDMNAVLRCLQQAYKGSDIIAGPAL
jgi:hypothetical protein